MCVGSVKKQCKVPVLTENRKMQGEVNKRKALQKLKGLLVRSEADSNRWLYGFADRIL